MTSHSDLIKPTYEIHVELKKAQSKLQDAIWEEDEELQEALKRQIARLQVMKDLSEKYEYKF